MPKKGMDQTASDVLGRTEQGLPPASPEDSSGSLREPKPPPPKKAGPKEVLSDTLRGLARKLDANKLGNHEETVTAVVAELKRITGELTRDAKQDRTTTSP